MDEVKFIVEGEFREPDTILAKFDVAGEESASAKVAYSFKIDRRHMGASGITDNRTGKQRPPDSILINKGEAPLDALGKTALICYESNPQKIRSLYFAKP